METPTQHERFAFVLSTVATKAFVKTFYMTPMYVPLHSYRSYGRRSKQSKPCMCKGKTEENQMQAAGRRLQV